MNKLLHRIVLLLLISTFSNLAHSQKEEPQQLVQILEILEKRYEVKFSFETKTVLNIELYPLKEDLSLEEALDKLKAITNLNFEVLSRRFIAITPSDKTVHRLEEVVVTNYLSRGISKTNNSTITVDANAFDILPGLIGSTLCPSKVLYLEFLFEGTKNVGWKVSLAVKCLPFSYPRTRISSNL